MSGLECKTEGQIKDFAKELFFKKGKFAASTQEIADFAGVNRTLVNYYFRSKNNLFEVVYWEMINELRTEFAQFYAAKIPFRTKVESIIDFLIDFRIRYPYLEIFNMQESVKLSNQVNSILQPKLVEEINQLMDEVKVEMAAGRLPSYHPKNFLVNIFSLVSYPIIMQPIFERILDVDQEEYETMLKERREIILQILFNQAL